MMGSSLPYRVTSAFLRGRAVAADGVEMFQSRVTAGFCRAQHRCTFTDSSRAGHVTSLPLARPGDAPDAWGSMRAGIWA